MREEDKLIQKYGRDTGYKVPEGYFDEFYARMRENLPEYPETPKVPEMTRWQRLKPYIYLAAMFCGIWCMMKIFSDVSSRFNNMDQDVPENVVLAISDAPTGDYFVEAESIEQNDVNYNLQAEMSQLYDNIDDFESDFDYQLRPEYANLQI